jgi:hypothetical protein
VISEVMSVEILIIVALVAALEFAAARWASDSRDGFRVTRDGFLITRR